MFSERSAKMIDGSQWNTALLIKYSSRATERHSKSYLARSDSGWRVAISLYWLGAIFLYKRPRVILVFLNACKNFLNCLPSSNYILS